MKQQDVLAEITATSRSLNEETTRLHEQGKRIRRDVDAPPAAWLPYIWSFVLGAAGAIAIALVVRL